MKKKSEFAKRIQSARKAKGLTQPQLAAMLGISEIYIRKIEADQEKPSYRLLCNLCILLDIHIFELIDIMNPNSFVDEFITISAIINSSKDYSIESGNWWNEGSKYSTNDCSIFKHDQTGRVIADRTMPQYALVEEAFRIQTELNQEYNKRILRYVKNLFSENTKNSD